MCTVLLPLGVNSIAVNKYNTNNNNNNNNNTITITHPVEHRWPKFCTEWYSLTTEKYFGILLTYSMVQSPSWEANWFAASQEIPRISRNPKIHYRTHKRPPPVSILSQPNPVHIPTSHLLEIHPNIIHPSRPRSPHYLLTYLLHGAESFLSS